MEHRDAGYEKREKARKRYEPKKIEWLLVAEAPPEDLDRYFYFEKASEYDHLFRETIHAIYQKEFPEISSRGRTENEPEYRKPNTNMLRKRKAEFLRLFKEDRFHLIDALESPIPQSMTNSKSEEMVKNGLQDLVLRMRKLAGKDTNVILIKSSVCALEKHLKDNGFKVVNEGVVPFPSTGRQKIFREKMVVLLKPYFKKRKNRKRRKLI